MASIQALLSDYGDAVLGSTSTANTYVFDVHFPSTFKNTVTIETAPTAANHAVRKTDLDTAISGITIADATATTAGIVKMDTAATTTTVFDTAQVTQMITTATAGGLTTLTKSSDSSSGLSVSTSGNTGTITIKDASTTAKGLVQLTDAVDSTSSTLAASAKAVKQAYDAGNGSAKTGVANIFSMLNTFSAGLHSNVTGTDPASIPNKAYIDSNLQVFVDVLMQQAMTTVVNGSQFFQSNSKLYIFPYNLYNLKNGHSMFSNTNLVKWDRDLTSLEMGDYMFAGCALLETFSSRLDQLVNVERMFTNDITLHTCVLTAPKLESAQYCFEGCVSLVTGPLSLPKLVDGYYMFYGCTALTTVCTSYPMLTLGYNMFYNCNLSKETIDAILTSLPDRTGLTNNYGTGTITFTGCPGAATCNKSIGEAKNWIVEI